ncbi:MAG: transcriptional regulator [Gemmatimonadetes bacterium]|nr:MAG: transcriptional regulator [Gemmatimonadota bacterium]
MNVPLLDLVAQYRAIKDEVLPAIQAVIESQQFVMGPAVPRLEAAVARLAGATHGIACASGTDALLLPLKALDLGPGDEVITTPFTFFATAGTIHNAGGTPVFVDIEPDTFNIDPAAVEAPITPRTRAIVPVHLYGQMAAMERLGAIGRARDLPIIEEQYHHDEVGTNSRLDTLQAAVLLAKLPHLGSWSAKRREHAAFYTRALADLPAVRPPVVDAANEHIFHQYTVRVERRDELYAHLKSQGIGSAIYYPVPLHLQPCFSHLGYRPGRLPESERASGEVLSLPVYPELTRGQLDCVIETIRGFYR